MVRVSSRILQGGVGVGDVSCIKGNESIGGDLATGGGKQQTTHVVNCKSNAGGGHGQL